MASYRMTHPRPDILVARSRIELLARLLAILNAGVWYLKRGSLHFELVAAG